MRFPASDWAAGIYRKRETEPTGSLVDASLGEGADADQLVKRRALAIATVERGNNPKKESNQDWGLILKP